MNLHAKLDETRQTLNYLLVSEGIGSERAVTNSDLKRKEQFHSADDPCAIARRHYNTQ
jgi:hypothetical protein